MSDLDGTLLDNTAALSDRTRQNIALIRKAGIPFTIATARSVQSVQPIFRGVKLAYFIVTFNGAYISDLATGGFEMIRAIHGATAYSAYELSVRDGLSPYLSTNDSQRDNLYIPKAANPGMEYYQNERETVGDPRLRKLTDVEACLQERVVCLTIIERRATLERFQSRLASLSTGITTSMFENRYSPGWYWLTIRSADAEKGKAIREFMRRYGFTDHRLVVFGDEMNDIEMFSEADFGVAVANAVPEILSVADEIIGTNISDAVTGYIIADSKIG